MYRVSYFPRAPFEERVQFVTDNMDKISLCAKDPFNSDMWWLKAENPWQFLAVCMDIHSAMSSENPLEYVSRTPIHQDGTCNGLQHYAALGRDVEGAKQVNLAPTESPSDVYVISLILVLDILELPKKWNH